MDTQIPTQPFDPATRLDADGMRDLLDDALASGDDAYIRHALKTVARARGMAQLARDSGVTREALYKAFGEDGDPKLSTLVKVLGALQIRLTVAPASKAVAAP